MREHARDRAAPVKADEVTRVGLALTGDGIGARSSGWLASPACIYHGIDRHPNGM
jgi:hypothetical protein